MSLSRVEYWWELDAAGIPSGGFFRAVLHALPSATTLFAEGCAIQPSVLVHLEQFRERGPYLPGRDTIFPKSTLRRYSFGEALVEALEELLSAHDVSEVFDHVTIYERSRPLLYWHDAFENTLRVAGSVSEARVAEFAQKLGVAYERG
jgi:hypothetical protein